MKTSREANMVSDSTEDISDAFDRVPTPISIKRESMIDGGRKTSNYSHQGIDEMACCEYSNEPSIALELLTASWKS
jgi:hypothetical protein